MLLISLRTDPPVENSQCPGPLGMCGGVRGSGGKWAALCTSQGRGRHRETTCARFHSRVSAGLNPVPGIQCPASRGVLSRGQNHLLGASDRSGKLEGLYPCRRDLSFSDTSLFISALKRRAWSCPGSLQLCPPQWEWPLPAPLLSLLSRHTQTLRQTALFLLQTLTQVVSSTHGP